METQVEVGDGVSIPGDYRVLFSLAAVPAKADGEGWELQLIWPDGSTETLDGRRWASKSEALRQLQHPDTPCDRHFANWIRNVCHQLGRLTGNAKAEGAEQ